MKPALAMLALGLAALILQGGLARTLSPPWCPDLALLVVVAIGLRWPGFLSGLVVAAILGYWADLVSGSLMGQHALLRMLCFASAALAARQLDLSGALPVSIFVFLLTLAYGFATLSILSFFLGSSGLGLHAFGQGIAHALSNVVAMGLVLPLVERVLARLTDEDVGRRAPLPMGFQRRSVG